MHHQGAVRGHAENVPNARGLSGRAERGAKGQVSAAGAAARAAGGGLWLGDHAGTHFLLASDVNHSNEWNHQ